MIHYYGQSKDEKGLNETLLKIEKRRIVPNLETYNSLIHAYINLNKMEKALIIFNEYDFIPDIITFNILLSGLTKLKDDKNIQLLNE